MGASTAWSTGSSNKRQRGYFRGESSQGRKSFLALWFWGCEKGHSRPELLSPVITRIPVWHTGYGRYWWMTATPSTSNLFSSLWEEEKQHPRPQVQLLCQAKVTRLTQREASAASQHWGIPATTTFLRAHHQQPSRMLVQKLEFQSLSSGFLGKDTAWNNYDHSFFRSHRRFLPTDFISKDWNPMWLQSFQRQIRVIR